MRLPKVRCDVGAYEPRIDPDRRTTARGRRKAERMLTGGANRCDTCRHCRFFAEDGSSTTRLLADYAVCAVSKRVVKDERGVDEGRKARRVAMRAGEPDILPFIRTMRWEPSDLFAEIGSRRPVIATLVGEEGFVFDVNEDGSVGTEPGQDLIIRARVMRLAAEVPVCGVIMRTFLTETVAVPHGTDRDRLVRVPVKELRAYQITRDDHGSDIVLCWTQLPPEAVHELFETDPATGKRVPLMVSERDHRFW